MISLYHSLFFNLPRFFNNHDHFFPFFEQDQGFGLLMGKLQAALDADAFTNDAVVKYVCVLFLNFIFTSILSLLCAQ